MQCNTVAGQDDQSVVLRLTRRAQSLGTRQDVEQFREPLASGAKDGRSRSDVVSVSSCLDRYWRGHF
jgi:hypothetical protein